MSRNITLVIISVALWSGCSSCKKKSQPGSVSKPPVDVSALATPDFLRFVPAETPMVFGSLRPMPASFLQAMGTTMAPIMDIINKKLAEEIAKTPNPNSLGDKLLHALWKEMGNNISLESIRKHGFSTEARFVFYTIGASLALRLELADGNKLSALIQRLETAVGKQATQSKIGTVSYFVGGDGDVTAVAAVVGNELIAGIMPTKAKQEILPVLLGKELEKNLAITGGLHKLVAKYGFQGLGTGYVDFERISQIFSGKGFLVNTFQHVGLDPTDLEPACRSEIAQLAAKFPRIVAGYEHLDDKKLTGLAVLEVAPKELTEIAGLRGQIPGLEQVRTQSSMVSLAINIDVGKWISWIEKLGKKISQDPYKCSSLRSWNEGAREIAEASTSAISAVVSQFRGGMAILNTITWQPGEIPTDVQGQVVFAHANPTAILQQAKSKIPFLAGLTVEPNGKPVPVAIGFPGVPPVHVAMRANVVGISVGKDTDAMVAALAAPSSKNAPLFLIRYDYSQFLQLVSAVTADKQPELSQIITAGPAKVMGPVLLELIAHANGLGFRTEMNFQD